MKVIIIGGGPSGLLASIAIKKNKPEYDILLIDKNNKIGKKLRATGNGKSNILNIGNIKNKYSNSEIAQHLFSEITPTIIINYFKSLGIETINYGDYVYPYSESANYLTDTLYKISKNLGNKILLNTTAIDYKNDILITNNGKYKFDKLVIATGLASKPKLGADATFINNLTNHKYLINKIVPSLTPIICKESTSKVNGIRRKVNLKVTMDKKIYFNEDGELIFKKDGLSGIVIFNASNAIRLNKLEHAKLEIDFLPNTKFENKLTNYLQTELADYLLALSNNPKKVIFNVVGFYKENDSIASIGGVSFNNLDSNFKSKIEDNVYIIGEALDQIGMCGGFNLMWAFATSLKVSSII